MAKETKKDKLKEVTTGLEPIVGDNPAVEIEGKQYNIRRLGIADTFKLTRILSIGVSMMGGSIESMNAKSAAMALFAAIPRAEKEIIDLLASLIGVKPEEIRDPDLFPMGSEIAIIEELVKHQDMQAFFTRLGKMIEGNPALQQVVQQAQKETDQETAEDQ